MDGSRTLVQLTVVERLERKIVRWYIIYVENQK